MSDNVLVVSVVDYCFETALEDHYYAFPYSSSREIPEYIAFYRIDPVSSITHFAKVQGVVEGDDIDETYRLIAFGDKADEKAIVVHFEDIKELDNPVNGEGLGVQAPMYSTLDELKEADIVKNLMDLSD